MSRFLFCASRRTFLSVFVFLFLQVILNAQAPCANIPALNTVVAGPNPYCSGTSITIGLSNAYAVSGMLYTWSMSSSSVASTFSNFLITSNPTPSINPTGSFWLRVAVTCTNGNQTTTMQPIFVSVATNSMSIPGATICSGQQASLSASSAGNINWYTTLTSTISINSGSAFVTPTLASGTYTFYAEATNACTFAPFRFPATVMVNPSPTIAVTNATLCLNQNSYTIAPGGALSYTYSSGTPLVSPSITTVYSVSGTNAFGCVTTATLVVVKTSLSPPTLSVNSGSICPNFPFTIQPTGAATYTIEGGSAVVTPSVSQTYTVVGTATNGCSSTVASTVSVWPSPTITANNSTICIGSVYTINPSGALTYTFIGGGPVVSPSVTTTYAVIGTDANGCDSNNALMVSITVHSIVPSVTVNSGSICLGNTFFITPTGANTYTYSSVSNWVSPLVSTVYTVTGRLFNSVCTASATSTVIVYPGPQLTVTNIPTVICTGENASITANGALTYTWNNVFNGNFLIVSPLAKTDYTIVAADAFGCTSTTVLTQYVNKCLSNADSQDFEIPEVYPNPVKDWLVVSGQNEAEVLIDDLKGKRYVSQVIHETPCKVFVGILPEGIYVIRLRTITGVFVSKLIKLNE
jgi:hypothetical protein